MKRIFLFILLLINIKVFAQQPVYNGEKKFSAAQIQSDFHILTTTIQEYHPSCYRYITPDSLQRYIDKVTSSLNDSLTDNEFHIIAREFLVQIHCGHTVAMPSEEWYSYQKLNPKAVPLDVIILNNRIFIKESFSNNPELPAGTEIISIDNNPAPVIIERMKSIHARDGITESFVNYSVQKIFRTYYLFLYGSKPSYQITYRNANNDTDSVVVEVIPIKQKPSEMAVDTTLYTLLEKSPWSGFYISKSKPDIAFLDIKNFGRGKYKKYYKKVFRDIRSKNIDHLIIDVRDNGGGYFPNGNRLLRYISDEKFVFAFDRPKHKPVKQEYIKMQFFNRLTRFAFNMIPDKRHDKNIRSYTINYKPKKKDHYHGKVYVLTNGGSFSLSSHVASFLKHKTDAVLIGQETGGGEEGSNALISYKLTLPATKIRVFVPYYHLDHRIKSDVVGRGGVIPDIEINYTPEDILQKKDKELEQILIMINNGITITKPFHK
jgi:C-terminal processing protease CtpA/Prc